jgi:hypothetical protein
MDRFAFDISDEWERHLYDTDGGLGANFEFEGQDEAQSNSRQTAGYSSNNPVLARIDYRQC